MKVYRYTEWLLFYNAEEQALSEEEEENERN